jgi:hypothetical protein
VKWGALLHLAANHEIRKILQVAYLQVSSPPVLEADSTASALPLAVWQHFRDLHQVQGLARASGLEISVLDWPFSHRGRAEYGERLIKHVAGLGGPKLVLLDPDTGIAPKNYDGRHVTRQEVTAVWHSLRPRDWLLLYQHARRSKTWVQDTLAEFNACCSDAEATIFRSRAAPDVVLFAVSRTAA